MSKIVLACANKLQRPRLLSKFQANHRSTCHNLHNKSALLAEANQNVNLIRHASTNIVNSPFKPIEIPNTDVVQYIWKDTEKWDDEIVAVSKTKFPNKLIASNLLSINRQVNS